MTKSVILSSNRLERHQTFFSLLIQVINVVGDPKFVCEVCGQRFYFGTSLTKHVKGKHLKMRPCVCEFCNKAFSGRHALATHRRQHTNETPYKCEVCGEGFRQRVSLRAHKKSKHNIIEPITCTCSVCGKGFSSDWALQTHFRLH